MKKIRINELARELEVKAHEILDRLPELGVAEKKTHSSSIDEDVAIKLRRLYGFDVPDLEPETEPEIAAMEETLEAPAAVAEAPAAAEVEAVAVEATAEGEPAETGPAELQTDAKQSGTIEDAGSPTHKPSEGTVPEGIGPEEGTPDGSGQ